MKKLAILLAFALVLSAASFAMAETRTETIQIGGVSEQVQTERFESARGYTMWIDKANLTPAAQVEGDDVDLFTGADGLALEIYFGGGRDATLEQIGNDAMDMLLENYGQVEEVDASALFPGYTSLGFSVPSGDQRVEYYLVEVEGSAFHFNMTYTAETAEGLVERVHNMLKSFEPLTVEAAG